MLRFLLLAVVITAAGAAELRVCATVPELGDLVRRVGGEHVSVTIFARPGDDPHHIDARPSFVRDLARADVLVVVGMELELGWVPALLQSCRNRAVQPREPGYVDCSRAIAHPLGIPAGIVDRSHGDVHPHGNPHYLLDPLNGLRVAGLLRDRFSAIVPEHRDDFAGGYQAFADQLLAAFLGDVLAERWDAGDVLQRDADGTLPERLAERADELGGWLGRMAPHRGSAFVDHHNLWPYLARRYGLRIAAHLEPKPGIPPSSTHLSKVVASMRAQDLGVIVIAPNNDPRPAELVAKATDAALVVLPHQVGSQPDSDDYISFCNAHVRRLSAALGGER